MRKLTFILYFPLIAFVFFWLNANAEIGFTSFKILSKSIVPAKNVEVDVIFQSKEEINGKNFMRLRCDMTAKHSYSRVEVKLDIVSLGGGSSWNSSQIISLAKGYNSCSFLLPLVEMGDGKYDARLEVKYTQEEKPAVVNFQIEKISEDGLKKKLQLLTEKFEEVKKSQINNDELSLLSQLLKEANKKIEEGNWEDASDSLNTLEDNLESMQASFLNKARVEVPRYSSLSLSNDGIFEGDKAVCVAGIFIESASSDKVKKVIDFKVPFVVLSLGLEELIPQEINFEGYSVPENVLSVMDDLLEAGIYLIVQLDQQRVPVWLCEKYPELNDNGFVNLAHGSVHELSKKIYEKLIQRYGDKKNYLGTSLFVDPRFKFDGEQIRKKFIEWVVKNYSDRQVLNQTWHAHLADFEEITIWDDLAPSWSYQNKRAYQYDWQNFHRGIITEFLNDFVRDVKSFGDKPISISFLASVFQLNETNFTPNRESIFSCLDFIALNLSANMYDSVYAQGYPDPIVDVVWANAVMREKPLIISRADLSFVGDIDTNEKYQRVWNFLWEAVISGAQAVAVNLNWEMEEDIPVLKAIADANRFFYRYGEVIRAFQKAKPDVSIIFSDSSKILDGGVPHLKSAKMAYEGSSFAGYKIGFATETMVKAGAFEETNVVIMPQILALEDEVFKLLSDYVVSGKYIIRVGTQIPYDPRGVSRRDVIQPSGNTVLVRGMNLPTEYLYGMDAIISKKALRPIPRLVNKTGYPIEGLKSRFIPTEDGGGYLYIVSLRKESVLCRLDGYLQRGENLINGMQIEFPRLINPLEVLFIRLYPPKYEAEVKQADRRVEVKSRKDYKR